MAYWLVKSDPDTYSWENLLKDKKTDWDGVRNYQARNNLKLMEVGDNVLVYESQSTRFVAGIAEVTKHAFQDTTTDDERWLAVELKAIKSLKNPVTLETIKNTPALKDIALIKQSRLSVMPLKEEEYNTIIDLSK
ncbi:MAG: EVE domain-containing protein [Candidatus Kapabacteria bacterium]|nr:EVE domain-containing protein [Ignavibacteriota bacterium]MCW5885445.1 EVE domain-containing protein [Candidatus Kapabacteria bacterium]